MTKIKFCGLKSRADIEIANELKIDYVGFIFAKNSSRYISPDLAARMKKDLCHEIKAVGVFVNESIDKVVPLLAHGIIDIVQLHGDEDESYIKSLRQRTSNEIFKAFSIKCPKDIENANNSTADMVLLDAGCGGTGTTFDWSLLKQAKRDYILAGGLNNENIEDVILRINPYGVDVSSGIETNGVKDYDKMRSFVEKIRRAGL
ncbi:MAG: phosphoribosylanthranilate isomerase [Lachnospiraceae bacterium]|nr:phosphoribosylanthranilate isomerase [Lachnospiraceae bacterium]